MQDGYRTFEEANIDHFIAEVYNTKRLHFSLGYFAASEVRAPPLPRCTMVCNPCYVLAAYTRRLRKTPSLSTSSSTTSPRFRRVPRSAPDPLPTVPDPNNSPGRTYSSLEA